MAQIGSRDSNLITDTVAQEMSEWYDRALDAISSVYSAKLETALKPHARVAHRQPARPADPFSMQDPRWQARPLL
jgi:hypothetical protein